MLYTSVGTARCRPIEDGQCEKPRSVGRRSIQSPTLFLCNDFNRFRWETESTEIIVMKKKLIFLCFLSCMMVGIGSSCSKDDEPSNPDKPTTNNPNKPVNDPSNTVTVNLLSGQTYRESTKLGDYLYVYVDDAYNICGDGAEIVDLGQVAGLGNITSAPLSGWKSKTAAIVGHGYMLRSTETWGGDLARLYIDSEMVSVGGGIMGYTVKYQCPMENQLVLQAGRSYSFNKTGGSDSIRIKSGTGITVKSKPEWINVEISGEFVNITAFANSGAYREGEIVLSNPVNSVTIRVYQSGN